MRAEPQRRSARSSKRSPGPNSAPEALQSVPTSTTRPCIRPSPTTQNCEPTCAASTTGTDAFAITATKTGPERPPAPTFTTVESVSPVAGSSFITASPLTTSRLPSGA